MPNIIINNICNQKCSYCFAEESMDRNTYAVQNQKLSTFLQILKFLKQKWYKDVRILWWEPLLHPKIWEFITIAKKWWFETRIFSNLNFSPELIKRKFDLPWSIPDTINANINNTDFYTATEYENVTKNLCFFRDAGSIITIGYNIYDLNKNFDDIIEVAKKTDIKRINLKITNSSIGSPIIIDTWTREYWEYIINIIKRYGKEYEFVFSCGLSPDIFTYEEKEMMHSLWIELKYGCKWFAWWFDIDIDWTIYKCFPTKSRYNHKRLSIRNFTSEEEILQSWNIQQISNSICLWHTLIP